MTSSYLVLEDGTIMEGTSFGYEGECVGDIVFTTCAGGYQEILTDPAFRGDILMFTYPIIGNGGVTPDCNQTEFVHVRGVVVRECCYQPSPMYKGTPFNEFLIKNKIPAIEGIDTRALVVKIREEGVCKGAIVSDKKKAEEMAEKLRSMPSFMDEELVAEVSVKKEKDIANKKKLTVGVIDLGIKNGLMDQLNSRFNVKIFPYDTPADRIITSGVDGLLVSDGPGNPAAKYMEKTAENVKIIAQKLPVMGLSCGASVVALAFGAKTVKMKFGHRGENQPVRIDGKVIMTYQNHGFEIDEKSVSGTGLVIDQININDKSPEGFRHEKLPVFGVMYHPEACPGPNDTVTQFDRFQKMIEEAKQ